MLAACSLTCNGFVLPYSTSLADLAALVGFQWWLAALLASHRASTTKGEGLAWFGLAACLAGVCLALRPAYAWLLVIQLIAALWWSVPMGRRIGARLALATCLPLLALLPQVAINQKLYQIPSPLPVIDLGQIQLRLGIENLKYATAPKPGHSVRMFYLNPFVGDTLAPDESASLGWYVHHPLLAAGTLSTKLVGAFDFDFLYPYVWDRQPRYQTVARCLSLFLLALGLQGMWWQVRGRLAAWGNFGPRGFPLLLFGGWSAITLLTAVELRFSLPMLQVLVLSSIAAGAHALRRTSDGRWTTAIAVSLATAGLYGVARFVSQQNVLLPG